MLQVSLPIPTDHFVAIIKWLQKNHDPREPVRIIQMAVQEWLDRQEGLFESPSTAGTAQGYQWQQVFLPDGTVVRTRFKGSCAYAEVKGGEFVFEGQSMSPSQWLNGPLGGNCRNAWKNCWIKLPGERTWRLADEYRMEAQGTLVKKKRTVKNGKPAITDGQQAASLSR